MIVPHRKVPPLIIPKYQNKVWVLRVPVVQYFLYIAKICLKVIKLSTKNFMVIAQLEVQEMMDNPKIMYGSNGFQSTNILENPYKTFGV